MLFTELGLSADILRAVSDQGYSEPTPIQAQAIPVVLEGRDVLAGAQTGTGKTAGFTLPLLQRKPAKGNRPVRALVLTPTRELAAQVGESVKTYGKHLPIRSAVIFGGVKINPQIAALRQGVDIVVATPGRLLEHQLEQDGLTAAAIHGNKSQGARTKALADFKRGKVRVLVATDIAARGLDIDQLPHVVNFELPNVPEDYVHRIGRTGRAGNEGEAVSLVCVDENKLLRDIERLLKSEVPKVSIDGFEPDPTIKAEPIQNGRQNRGGGQSRSGSRGRSNSGHNSNKSGNQKNVWGGKSANGNRQPRSNTSRTSRSA
ncbi:UNVERIFIED_CONTAM: hypothetical protein GTU68_019132 [Idotea baltica]|nr:hypothetical protein [Idotea baltica]